MAHALHYIGCLWRQIDRHPEKGISALDDCSQSRDRRSCVNDLDMAQ